nr:MAG TPA: hypothetical protein [Crassvirales sp.]
MTLGKPTFAIFSICWLCLLLNSMTMIVCTRKDIKSLSRLYFENNYLIFY